MSFYQLLVTIIISFIVSKITTNVSLAWYEKRDDELRQLFLKKLENVTIDTIKNYLLDKR